MINVQILRGTAAQVAAYTGKEGELTLDYENWLLYVHDGTTPGGHLIGGTSITIPTMLRVTTGTTDTLSTLTRPVTQIIWTSATVGAKTQNIPSPSAYDGYSISLKTTVGDNSAFSIVPASGTIDGQASLDFNDVPTLPRTAYTLRADTTGANWWVI